MCCENDSFKDEVRVWERQEATVKETVVLLIRTRRGVDEKADGGPDERGVQEGEKRQAGKREGVHGSWRMCVHSFVCLSRRAFPGVRLCGRLSSLRARAYVACVQLCMCAILVGMQAGPRLDPQEWRNNTTGSSGVPRQFNREW